MRVSLTVAPCGEGERSEGEADSGWCGEGERSEGECGEGEMTNEGEAGARVADLAGPLAYAQTPGAICLCLN